MLAWWLIFAELGAARARAIPIPSFLQELRLERAPRWPSFVISGLLHIILLALLPSLNDWLQATRPEYWIRRHRILPSVEIRVPERLYLAAVPRSRPGDSVRQNVARRSARPRSEQRLGSEAIATSRARLRRRFQLPNIPSRPVEQTLLQPDFPIEIPALARLSLPELFFWAPKPSHPAFQVRKPFLTPGSAEPFAQPPAFDAPPQLTPPNWEALAAAWQAASSAAASADSLLLPSLSLPIRFLDLLPRPPKTFISVERGVGDPLSVLALNRRSRPVREDLVIPPGSQLADGEPIAGGSTRPESDTSPSEAGASTRPDAGASSQASKGPALGSGTSQRGQPAEPAEADPAAKAHASDIAPSPAGAPARRDSLAAVQGQPQSRESELSDAAPSRSLTGAREADRRVPSAFQQPASGNDPVSQAVRIDHPPGGVADVVVVQPAPMDGIIESTGALSGRPVYTVFLRVGAPREWILQYCVPGEEQGVTISGGVVRLAHPGPLIAPYPRITYLPAVQPRPNSYLFLHGFLAVNGRFESLRPLRSADREEAAAILPVLERWEFRPAMRDGQPVRVEILLAIPRS